VLRIRDVFYRYKNRFGSTDEEFKYFYPKKLGSKILKKKLIPHLGSGSRSQKSSGSRIQIRNTEYGYKSNKTILTTTEHLRFRVRNKSDDTTSIHRKKIYSLFLLPVPITCIQTTCTAQKYTGTKRHIFSHRTTEYIR